ncbi:MAG TPA: Gfo/Idh/MocA family oxidoreductase, partial [Planctomycetota bacterium]|nr:Gfo/Idh/MocA family oxidoreductase [Planctomycetota bacterium]
MSRVRVGFIGVGGMGQMAHLSNYAALADKCQVVALAEARPGLGQLVATRYGVPHVFKDHKELLAKADVDCIVASQPYTRHSILVPDVLERKLPVFTEKPLCLTVEEGEKLVALGEKHKVLHMVGYHKRSDPATQYAVGVIDEWKASGEFGKMRYVRVTMPPGDWIGGMDRPLDSSEPYPQNLEWEKPPAEFDKKIGDEYNAFVNYYIHQVNAIRFLLREPYKVTYADPSRVLMACQSDSGVCATLEMAPYQSSIDWHETFFVAFEKGYVKVELPAPLARQRAGRVTVFRDNGKGTPTVTEPVLPMKSAMRCQAENFLAAVRGERAAPCVAREALEDLKIARDYTRLVNR